MDYGSWTLNHPVRATLIFALAALTGAAVGVGIAALLPSPATMTSSAVLIGASLGIGGVMAGMAAGGAALAGIDRRGRKIAR